MQREYPQQLATLRSQLTEVDHALALIEEELSVSEQVVSLCTDDLEALRPQAATVAYDDGASSRALSARVEHVTHTRQIYQSRYDMAAQERVVLESERRQITAELTSLEQEAAEFQSQIALIQNEIDSLARSEKLIQIAEARRSARQDRIGTRASGALERLNQTIAAERARQTETLKTLADTQSSNEYELRAKLLLEAARHAEAGSEPARNERTGNGMF
jgi:chromosome segregation ATPase